MKDPIKLHEQINIKIDKFERLVEDIKERSNMVKALTKHLKMRQLSSTRKIALNRILG